MDGAEEVEKTTEALRESLIACIKKADRDALVNLAILVLGK